MTILKWESNESVELLDEHYYRNPAWFAENFNKYDNYDRKGSEIYVGEYAVTQGFGNMGSLDAALGEAVYMMGIENNSRYRDHGILRSYLRQPQQPYVGTGYDSVYIRQGIRHSILLRSERDG